VGIIAHLVITAEDERASGVRLLGDGRQRHPARQQRLDVWNRSQVTLARRCQAVVAQDVAPERTRKG